MPEKKLVEMSVNELVLMTRQLREQATKLEKSHKFLSIKNLVSIEVCYHKGAAQGIKGITKFVSGLHQDITELEIQINAAIK